MLDVWETDFLGDVSPSGVSHRVARVQISGETSEFYFGRRKNGVSISLFFAFSILLVCIYASIYVYLQA